MKRIKLACPWLFSPLFLLAFVAPMQAGDSSMSAQAAFEKVKGLAGEWTGAVDSRDSGKAVTVVYRVTSSGNAVVETLFPGSDHEMITVYHLDGDKLVLTHYCTVGNQPRMTLAKASTPGELSFDFAGGSNVKPKRDKHMHAMRMKFEGPNALNCEWDFFADGKKAGMTKFFVARKP
jgi:hypothetical protein